jgi:hypothetical protein
MMGSLTEGFTGWCDGEERPTTEREMVAVELSVEHVEARRSGV